MYISKCKFLLSCHSLFVLYFPVIVKRFYLIKSSGRDNLLLGLCLHPDFSQDCFGISPKYFGIPVCLIDITGTINVGKMVAAGFSLRLLRTLKGAATKS
jgi:hypothetical protein